MEKIVRFKIWDCKVVKLNYGNGATAIRLVDIEDGGPVATATVNMVDEYTPAGFTPSESLPKDECYIKTWGENKGMVEALAEAGVIEVLDKRPIPVGPYGETAPHCKILI